MRSIRVIVVALAGLFLAACAADSPAHPQAANTATSAPSNAPGAAEQTPSFSPSESQLSPTVDMRLGTKVPYTSTDNAQLTAQVLDHTSIDDAEAVDVRLCNVGVVVFSVTRAPWVLLYEGGDSEHNVDISGGGLPAPAYPDSFDPKELKSDKCARGWINYISIPGKRPYGIAYNIDGTTLAWKF
jgi:hypothetical protein